MDLPEITEVKRVTPQAGDRLVVRLKSWPSDKEAQECSDRVRGILDWHGPLLVIGPEVDVEVIGPEAAEPVHDKSCCMEGAWPGWGAHPDCPGKVAGKWADAPESALGS